MASESGIAQTQIACYLGVAGQLWFKATRHCFVNRISLEREATEGNSPVGKNETDLELFLSTTSHVQSCGNLGGPSSKAKYSLATDSELVPRGKGEKNPC